MAEQLKDFDDILKPDTRSDLFTVTNLRTGDARKAELEDVFALVSSITLSDSVPEDIISQFNIARNLAIYTWFSYSFHQISELKSFSTLESALRHIYPHKRGLGKLISSAVKDRRINDIGFSHIASDGRDESSINYVNKLKELIPSFRNDLAHGSTTLHDGCFFTLRFCAEFINQLFNDKGSE
ncbi:hypothetical protein JW887_06180 [Candidatus Dojkabacteria bacterium]|nr:hypothetical protein [Candidatus Dojkabacteria bacterium]